jgi:hypothetical protein
MHLPLLFAADLGRAEVEALADRLLEEIGALP